MRGKNGTLNATLYALILVILLSALPLLFFFVIGPAYGDEAKFTSLFTSRLRYTEVLRRPRSLLKRFFGVGFFDMETGGIGFRYGSLGILGHGHGVVNAGISEKYENGQCLKTLYCEL